MNELDDLQDVIDGVTWRPTTYIEPHEYITKEQDPVLFAQLKQAIQEMGYNAPFKGRLYRYIIIGEYRYWAFDLILNRQKVED